MNPTPRPRSSLRRRLLAAPPTAAFAAWLAPFARAEAQGIGGAGSRAALLIGNRDYPDNLDLPPMHTNVRRLQAALEGVGFEVTSLFDQDRPGTLQAVDAFARRLQAMPADSVAMYYFCGHGMQIDAENFLLPSHVYPRERQLDESRRVYVELWQEVVDRLPRRPGGLTMTVIDACRTSPRPIKPDDGLNQVKAPPGELVVFSTGAGQIALSPAVEDRMTFFTDALVRRLEGLAREPEELSFAYLFGAVKIDVERTMLAHELADIRALAQSPFIADNSGRPIRVSLSAPQARPAAGDQDAADTRRQAERERAAFEELQSTLWPKDVARLAQEFAARFPQSGYLSTVEVDGRRAVESAKVLTDPDVSLRKADFSLRQDMDEGYNEDLRRAARGDKDAAARVAARLKPGAGQGPAALRYQGWMQYAGLLGNGIACHELSLFYNDQGRPGPAGAWLALARKAGYIPPPTLRTTR